MKKQSTVWKKKIQFHISVKDLYMEYLIALLLQSWEGTC